MTEFRNADLRNAVHPPFEDCTGDHDFLKVDTLHDSLIDYDHAPNRVR